MSMLLAAGAWALDVAFFVIIVLGIAMGVSRGFVAFLCKIAGTIFSVAIAITFCVTLQNSLESWFGMTTAIAVGIGNATIAKVLAIAISFVILVILVRLLTWLIGKLATSLIDKFAPLRFVNRLLGGIMGALAGVMLIFLLLAICHWIPAPSMHEFIHSSTVTGKVFDWVVLQLEKVNVKDVFNIVTLAPSPTVI